MPTNAVAPASHTAKTDHKSTSKEAVCENLTDNKIQLSANGDEDHLLGVRLGRPSQISNEMNVRHVKPASPWVISPKNKWRLAWDVVQACILIVLSIELPIRVGLNYPG
jgi:hypothetical protein